MVFKGKENPNKPQGVGWWPAPLDVANISPDWEVIDRVPSCTQGHFSYKS